MTEERLIDRGSTLHLRLRPALALAGLLVASTALVGCDDDSSDADAAVDSGSSADGGGDDGGTTPPSASPIPDSTEGPSDLTLYLAPDDALYVYWRDASDDETASDDLEYSVAYRHDEEPSSTVLSFTKADEISREAAGRMWIRLTQDGDALGLHTATVSVRDGDGNVAEYPALERLVIGCQVCR